MKRLTRIWVDRRAVEAKRDDVLVVTDPDLKVTRGNEVIIHGPSKIVYDKTVAAGVRVWIETAAKVETK